MAWLRTRTRKLPTRVTDIKMSDILYADYTVDGQHRVRFFKVTFIDDVNLIMSEMKITLSNSPIGYLASPVVDDATGLSCQLHVQDSDIIDDGVPGYEYSVHLWDGNPILIDW